MMTARVVHAIIVLTLLPLLTLRGRALRRYFVLDVATYAVAAIVWPHAHGLDAYLAAVGFVAVKLALFAVFLAAAREVRWSANRAAVIALLVYSLLIPAMQRTPIDGDEPFYLLTTESMVQDLDRDLSNQYRDLARSATGRPDLRPQPGDPTGARGEQYSRHEPLLSILLIPGYLLAGLPGALATIVVFAALLVRSTVRLLEDEGIGSATARAVFPFFAIGPPVLFYAARIWPEVPAAFFFTEAIRGVRDRRAQRWVPALLLLSMLKLRFVLVAAPLAARAVLRTRRHAILAALIIAVPLLILWLVTGNPLNVHSVRELIAPSFGGPFHGAFGLILDGAAGIAFQAPFYLLGVFALLWWKEMPEAFRLGIISSLVYVALLIPRSEWHGGWSPPLRYIVFLMPVLALGAAAVLQRGAGAAQVRRRAPAVLLGGIALWTIGLAAHGVAHPWRLFHIANGENVVGEYLSRLYRSDFSRLFPSFIRLNGAAIAASIVLLLALITFRLARGRSFPAPIGIALVATLMATAYVAGRQPASRIEFEDAHVVHHGGELYPHEYTIARFAYRGGWVLNQGDSLSFLADRGPAVLHYTSGAPSLIQLGSRLYQLDEASDGYRAVGVFIEERGRVVLRCVEGAVNLDRLERR